MFSFTYTLSDGASPTAGTDIGSVTLVILNGGNSAPVVSGPTNITLTGNSVNDAPITGVTDPGDTLKYYLLSSPQEGTATVDEAGNFDYTAGSNFDGLDSFKYIVIDSYGASAVGTVTINGPTGSGPKVAGVYVNSTDWNAVFRDYADGGFGGTAIGYPIPTGSDQLKTLPWINVNQIRVKFDSNVGASLDVGDFSLATSVAGRRNDGTTAFIPSVTSVSFDGATNVATLQLNQSIDASVINLVISASGVFDSSGRRLDGEWTNGVSSESGNTTQGGDFSFQFNVLPGKAASVIPNTGLQT